MTTLEDIKRFLDEDGLHYRSFEDDEVISVGFSSTPDETTYRDEEGRPCLGILIRLLENGEFLHVGAPKCWHVESNTGAVCEALAGISAKFKMIRWDLVDDHIVPNVEIPLEDSPLTAKQLRRAIGAILQVVKQYDRVVTRAIKSGVVSFHEASKEVPSRPTSISDAIDRVGGRAAAWRLLGGEP